MDAYEERLRVRFWKKVNKKAGNSCWEWTACKAGGYGQIYVRGKLVYAHRLSWVWANGKIPKGLFVLHKCDNRVCVNPDHLFLGTNKDNMQDCVRKGRFSNNNKPVTRLQASDGFVYCHKCDKFLPKESFSKIKRNKSHGCHSCCKKCDAEYSRARRAKAKSKTKHTKKGGYKCTQRLST